MSADYIEGLLASARDVRYSRTSTCWGFEDGLDGFAIHAVTCPNLGKSWRHSSTCVGYKTWQGPWPDWAGQ